MIWIRPIFNAYDQVSETYGWNSPEEKLAHKIAYTLRRNFKKLYPR